MGVGARRAGVATGVVGLALVMVAVGAVVGAGGDPAAPVSAPTTVVSQQDALATQVADLQTELERLPGNAPAWAELGLAYVEQARVSADPGLYARAEGAFARSLELAPEQNALALAGQGALSAARHDFAEALASADAALAANAFGATALAVRVDALTELGRYDEARTTVERMLEVAPGVESFTRASYTEELRGATDAARAAMTAAASVAATPSQVAFAQHILGELAWQAGDLARARSAYDLALAALPSDAPSRAGLARLTAAEGDPAGAVAAYREVTMQLPLPTYLVELGELLEATGDPRGAQQQYDVVRATQQLLAAAGQDVDTELAVFEADHGDPAAALASAEAAYARRPDGILTQDAYAWALHASGRSAEALPVARAALRLGTRSPVLHYHLGAIAAAAGDPDTARTALQTALELNDSFSPLHAPRARALLEQLG